jgi:hypothetical protein
MNSNVSQVIDGGLQIVGIIVLILGIAVFFLWKSMNRQIKKISTNLPEGPQDERVAEDEKFTEEAVVRGEEERDEDEQRT